MRVAVLSVYSRIQTSGSTFPLPHSGSVNAPYIPTKQREMSFRWTLDRQGHASRIFFILIALLTAHQTLWFGILLLLSIYRSIDRLIGLVKEKPGHRFDSKSSHFCLSMDRSIDLSVLWKKAWSTLWFEILPLLSIDWSIDRSIFVVKEKPGQRCDSKSSHFCLSIDRSVLSEEAWSTLWFEILPLLSVFRSISLILMCVCTCMIYRSISLILFNVCVLVCACMIYRSI